ncbi:two-component system sensor histidine kinase YcbA [Sedimentibacter acidaminivorans]|uniref:Two-component system sensor histidine kinase YcbA n=1 Tax=Sedimentibacter acidaminivorans TaxID=913099 RepID=A0ABS4G9Z2_9FIRM|nr:HAMP domain-containing sensor histidine kinase [Sedimentibacter acidaminivorans]MBP1924503.1 two-component system sensor histidine kinase YcbA [Sedimentibacter acidaminivorans]
MKKLQKTMLIGLIIVATSQLYLNFIIDGFRVSASVIIFPILLITYDDLNSIHTALVTAILVFIARFSILTIRGTEILQAIYSVYPGSLFYIAYGFIFKFKTPSHNYYLSKMFLLILMCDFISNVFEVMLRMKLTFTIEDFSYLFILFLIAATRASIVLMILTIIRNYKILLTREEHEKRYQNLIILTSSLKSEIYFMRKNSEDIEKIMSNSYILYEKLSLSNQNDEINRLSLNITKDIHEIKKDYLRVIKGIESILVDKIELTEMSIKDILYILKESTYRMLEDKKINIYLDFNYEVNFTTKSHFQLMSILGNLVNNAIESMEQSKKNGFVKIQHSKNNDYHIFNISDNGNGINPQNLCYIYSPGFSTKFNYHTGDVYRGIGLTHVKTLVNNHFNGSIDVMSVEKLGTQFEIKIPIANMEVYYEDLHHRG